MYVFVVIHNFLIEEKILLLGIEDFELDLKKIDTNLNVFGVSKLKKFFRNKKKFKK